MSFDVNRLKNKLEQLKNPGKKNGNANDLWKPNRDGTPSTVRVLPYPYGDDPFVELFFYYGVGDGPGFLAPHRNFGRPDPVHDFAQSLWNSGDKDDAELAKSLFPKQRIYAVVVDRDDPTMTPKFWGFGKQVYQTLIEHLLDDDYSNYMDANEGLDLEIRYEKNSGQSFPRTNLKFKRKESPLADSPEKIREILGNIKEIDKVFQPLTTAEVQERLNKWMSSKEEGEEEAKDTSAGTVKGGSSDDDEVNVPSLDNKKSIDDAFAEAMSNIE